MDPTAAPGGLARITLVRSGIIRRRRYGGVSYTGARASAGVQADDRVQVTHMRALAISVDAPKKQAPERLRMKAITVRPGVANSARLEDFPEPDLRDGSVLVEAIAVGVCGTDVEIVEGKYGWSPPGSDRLVLGHESLGRVLDPGPASSLKAGDLVVGIVRRPDPVPCPNCAVGEWDMCRNGRYTERGIKEIHGFMSERWRIEPEYAMKVDRSLGLLGVLLEPTTVVTKAWEQVVAVGQRAFWEPRTVLVTGAGPIGLLAALLGKQRGLDVHVLDRVQTGSKPELVRQLGATYHSGPVAEIGFEPDIIVECTGVGAGHRGFACRSSRPEASSA